MRAASRAMVGGILGLGVVGWCAPACATPPTPRPPSRPPANVGATGADFVKEVAQRSIAEVALGKLALQRAQNPEVRQFAQRVAAERAQANAELMDLAEGEGIERPQAMSPEQRSTNARLSTLSGAAFDREYMNAMLREYERDIALFRSYAQSGTDDGLKSWAARLLPILRKHQQLASTTAGRIGAS